MNKLLSLLFFFLIPSLAFAHGGPELFIFLWSIALLPAFIATAIAPKGFRLAWFIGGIVITVGSILLLGIFVVGNSILSLLIIPLLLVPAALFHRIKKGKK